MFRFFFLLFCRECLPTLVLKKKEEGRKKGTERGFLGAFIPIVLYFQSATELDVLKIKSETELTASVVKKDPKHTRKPS